MTVAACMGPIKTYTVASPDISGIQMASCRWLLKYFGKIPPLMITDKGADLRDVLVAVH